MPDGSVCMPFLSSKSASKSEEEAETLVTKTSIIIIQCIIRMTLTEANSNRKKTKDSFSKESKSHVSDIVSFSVKSSCEMEEEGEDVRGEKE